MVVQRCFQSSALTDAVFPVSTCIYSHSMPFTSVPIDTAQMLSLQSPEFSAPLHHHCTTRIRIVCGRKSFGPRPQSILARFIRHTLIFTARSPVPMGRPAVIVPPLRAQRRLRPALERRVYAASWLTPDITPHRFQCTTPRLKQALSIAASAHGECTTYAAAWTPRDRLGLNCSPARHGHDAARKGQAEGGFAARSTRLYTNETCSCETSLCMQSSGRRAEQTAGCTFEGTAR